jgi:hypothetical protein
MPVHTSAWEDYLRLLSNEGFTFVELDLMSKKNPAWFMGLDN